MTIKTYKGIIPDGDQIKLRLKTRTGSKGYRIVKFQGISNTPGTADSESTMMVWKEKQTSVSTSTATVDFSDQQLLGVLYYVDEASDTTGPVDTIIFDREIFNQDIYITHTATTGSTSMNFYLELEQVKLRDSENEYVTLKDLKQVMPQHGQNPPA